MTPLGQIIAAQIARTGPLSIAEYMALCLLHPEHGYYTTRDPLGAAGDFVTAPEISQMFGEMVGLCLAQSWLDQGGPTPFTLAELGPGRGTLMADILRATARVPGFHDAAQLHLVEASPTLRTVQKSALDRWAVHWHDRVDTLPARPLFLVANEFFDALPIRQFIRDDGGWRERVVGLQDDALCFGLTQPSRIATLEDRFARTQPGDLVETCGPAQTIAQDLGQRIADHGGAALIIDYGDADRTGDTFQAVQGHKKTDPLAAPGLADLTAHVDFAALARAAPCAATQLATQGVFLERLGITPRAQALAARLTGDALNTHVAAHRRLTHPSEMGTLFKVLGFVAEGAAPPPGLEL
ncbi:class I SAM-dependent methyltransferase [Thalassococcus sp. BH17M4-6]|uniref:class I SAM-dependent methyltransferase n=1 Tax=Thalassococcus sp. BH17M4-6 TaxID=3413148 RepID=UPI003BCE00EB